LETGRGGSLDEVKEAGAGDATPDDVVLRYRQAFHEFGAAISRSMLRVDSPSSSRQLRHAAERPDRMICGQQDKTQPHRLRYQQPVERIAVLPRKAARALGIE